MFCEKKMPELKYRSLVSAAVQSHELTLNPEVPESSTLGGSASRALGLAKPGNIAWG
jgi:hypothetical protein